MGSIRLYGSTSGYLELQAPDVSPDSTLVLPSDSLQPGLVHLHTETFSSVSSVSIDDVFSAEYENYRVLVRGTVGSAAANLGYRLRSSSVDNSASYYGVFNGIEYTGTARTTLISNGNYAPLVQMYGGHPCAEATIYGPFQSVTTRSSGTASGLATSGGNHVFGYHGLWHNTTTSFDGISVLVTSGTLTGSVSVYGYRNN